jgi:hypothetical protein
MSFRGRVIGRLDCQPVRPAPIAGTTAAGELTHEQALRTEDLIVDWPL